MFVLNATMSDVEIVCLVNLCHDPLQKMTNFDVENLSTNPYETYKCQRGFIE